MNGLEKYGLDVMTLAAHSLKSCLSLFLETGVPVLTLRIEPRGIFICESDSSQSIVVSSSFSRASFHRFKTPQDETVVFSVDTNSLVQSLKTATSSCSVEFAFEGKADVNDNLGTDTECWVPRKLVVVRTVDNKNVVDESVNNPTTTRLAFRHKIDILKCQPSQVFFDMGPIHTAAMMGVQMSFLIRHSTLANIVKEFSRLHTKELIIYGSGDDDDKVFFSSEPPRGKKEEGDDGDAGQDEEILQERGQQLEVILCDPQWRKSTDMMGDAAWDVGMDDNPNRMIVGISRPKKGVLIYGRFNLKILSRALKTQCSKDVHIFLIPPSVSSSSDPPPAEVSDAVLVIRQEPVCLGEINVVVPSMV